MPIKSTSTTDSTGYTTKKTIETDENGNVLSVQYDLYDPSGNHIGTYSSEKEVEDAKEKDVEKSSPSGPKGP